MLNLPKFKAAAVQAAPVFLDTKAVGEWEARHPELTASATKS